MTFSAIVQALQSAQSAEQVDLSVTDWTGAPSRAVRVEIDGVLKVDYAGGGTGVLVPVIGGVAHPLSVIKIYKVGTTASGNIVVER